MSRAADVLKPLPRDRLSERTRNLIRWRRGGDKRKDRPRALRQYYT
jgi:hypothetical protein